MPALAASSMRANGRSDPRLAVISTLSSVAARGAAIGRMTLMLSEDPASAVLATTRRVSSTQRDPPSPSRAR